MWYLNAGVNQGREPRSSHPSLTPSQLYRTKDGFIFIMCNKEKFWPELCRCIGRPEWATRPDYKDFKARLANRAQLTLDLDAALSAKTTAEWIEIFGGRVPAAPVHDVKAALENSFVMAEGRVRTVARPIRSHPPPRLPHHLLRRRDALPRRPRHGGRYGRGVVRGRFHRGRDRGVAEIRRRLTTTSSGPQRSSRRQAR